MNILFIGNSYTYVNNLPAQISLLHNSQNNKKLIFAEQISFGGASLRQHWERSDALKRIHSKQWDFVVLQEQSSKPYENREETIKYASLFINEIKKSKAFPLLYLTWANQKNPQNQLLINETYYKISNQTNCKVIPVGILWNYINNEYPFLNLYFSDGSHPSPLGTYVSSLVFYSILFQRDLVGLPNKVYDTKFPQNKDNEITIIDKEVATLLQKYIQKLLKTENITNI